MGGKPVRSILVLAALAAATLLAPTPATAEPVTGPDLPTATAPVEFTAFENEPYVWTEGKRTRTVTVPNVPFNRVFVELRVFPHPDYPDPWDRLVGVAVEGAEVLRGVTPRTDMTLRKEITEFASLFPRGQPIDVSMTMGSYEGGTLTTIRFELYNDPVAPPTHPAADFVAAPLLWRGLCGGSQAGAQIEFPATPAASGVVELTLSGHGSEELYLLQQGVGTREFVVYVDGEELARTTAYPYVYAILGFYGETGEILHPLMWWSAQRALDLAGVHTGTGELPPNRVTLDADQLARLTGARQVEVRDLRGGCVWITSATFLLDG